MLDAVLKNKSVAFRISVKSAISIVMIALSVGLPQIAHVAGGAAAGAVWLPMYLPALLAGCLLGWQWGLIVGIFAPITSFGITSLALGSAMPALARLPYMTLELAVFGLVSGLFAKYIRKNPLMAFPAVICAQISGRALYVIYNLIAGKAFAELWSSVQTGLTGLYLQAVIVPLIVIVLAKMFSRGEKRD